jgi:hypothetical protein
MSLPILRRLGFHEVGHVHSLIDDFATPRSAPATAR